MPDDTQGGNSQGCTFDYVHVPVAGGMNSVSAKYFMFNLSAQHSHLIPASSIDLQLALLLGTEPEHVIALPTQVPQTSLLCAKTSDVQNAFAAQLVVPTLQNEVKGEQYIQ